MTERYTISDRFRKEERNVLTQAVGKSSLPEGVTIAHFRDLPDVQKPFVVVDTIAMRRDVLSRSVSSYRAGAESYVLMDLDVSRLASSLSETGTSG